MVDIKKIVKNASPIIFILLIIGIGAWLILGPGLPFVDTPDTFEIEESVSFKETDSNVIITLDKPEYSNEIVVLRDGNEVGWSDQNQIIINKSTTQSIVLESYPDNQGLYETYEYPIESVVNNIRTPDQVYLGEENTYYIQSTEPNSELNNIRWYINGTTTSVNSLGIDRTFNTTGTKEIRLTLTVDGVKYETTKSVRVLEPNEILLDINISNQELKTYETFDLRISEQTNQGVENININFGDGQNSTIKENTTTRYWYTEPGTYEITIDAKSSTVSAEKTETIEVEVNEREENDTRPSILNVNIYDNEGTPISDATISIGSITKETDSRGFARVRLEPNSYNLRLSAPGYFSKNRRVTLEDDLTIEDSLARISSSDPDIPVGDDDEDLNLSDTPNEFEVEDETNQSEIPTGVDDVDSLILETFENLEGSGTDQDPYEISEYLELQSVRVQPSATYEVVNDIDASVSTTQYPVNNINESIGEADESLFILPYLQSEPNNISIRVDGEVVNPSEYNIVPYGEDPIQNNPRYAVAFTDNGNEISVTEAIGASPSDDIVANYSLSTTKYKGFEPIDIGNNVVQIDGNNHTINNIHINRPLENNVGLLKNARGGSIRNLRVSAKVIGKDRTAAILSSGSEVLINSVEVTGQIWGENGVGSVSGDLTDSTIKNTESYAEVRGQDTVGGIVGSISKGLRRSQITNTAVKLNEQSAIYGRDQVGGIAGSLSGTNIQESYAVTQIGVLGSDTPIIGGIAGEIDESSTVDRVFAVSPVSVSSENVDMSQVGSIIGYNAGTVEEVYWNKNIIRAPDVAIGNSGENSTAEDVVSLNETQMIGQEAPSNMDNFDFENTWTTTDYYPMLQSEINRYALTVRAEGSEGEIVSPTIRIIQDGEVIQSIQPDTNSVITNEFNLAEGQYTVQIESENNTDEQSVDLTSSTTVQFSFE
jgi:hypothetical protein